MKPLHTLTVHEAAALLASRALSPVDLTAHFLARIERLDHSLVAFLHVDAEGALRAARQAEAEIEAGRYRGPLHGIPFAVKDNFAAAGLPMTVGSRVRAGQVPAEDADSVARLRRAGAILLGKLNTWEYGTGNANISFDLPTPPARNPWSTAHFTGGSSSGSGAALAGGLALFTLGSDTGGSVRLPAAACGVFGLKPTLGRISRRGVLPNCYSFDTVGVLARCAIDSALVLDALAGHDPHDPMSATRPHTPLAPGLVPDVRGLRVGWVSCGGMPVQAPVLQALGRAARALEAAGAVVEPVEMPLPPSDYRRVSAIINWSESFAIHREDFLQHEDLMGHALREKLLKGQAVPASAYIDAQRSRRVLIERTNELFERFDLLLLPTAADVAPLIDDEAAVRAFTVDAATHAFSLTGHPAMAVPAGLWKGLPVSVQLGARHFDEARLLAASAVLESCGVPGIVPDAVLDAHCDHRAMAPQPALRLAARHLQDDVLTAVRALPRPDAREVEPADVHWRGQWDAAAV